MGQLTIPGTTIQYNNPQQVNRGTVLFPPGGSNFVTPGVAAGATWFNQSGCDGIPQPGSFDATKPQAPSIIFRNPA